MRMQEFEGLVKVLLLMAGLVTLGLVAVLIWKNM